MKRIFIFFDYYKPFLRYFFGGLFFVFISGVTQIASYILVGKIVDISTNQISKWAFSLNQTVIFLFFGILLHAISNFFQEFQFLKMSEFSLVRIRSDLYSRYLKFSVSFYDKERIGDLLSRINLDTAILQSIFIEQLPILIYQVFMTVISSVILFSINVKLTLLMLCVFPVTSKLAEYIGKKIRIISEKIQNMYAQSNIHVEETLQKIRTVKISGTENSEMKKYDFLLNKIMTNNLTKMFAKISLNNLALIITISAQVLIFSYGTHLVLNHEITTGRLIAFLIIAMSLGSAVSALSNVYASFSNAVGSTNRICFLLEEPVEEGYEFPQISNITFQRSILFKNVSFSYYKNENEKFVFSDLNFEIKKGEKIGIIGSTGNGKSTILKLLFRFYNPTKGSIYFDDVNILKFQIQQYRKLFAVVSQEIELFGFSVLDNIRYGNFNLTQDEVIAASKMAKAYEFICELPNGFETIIGENGVTLSGGQRQRIAIARALASNPQILVFDEATSALDYATEEQIKNELFDLFQNRTVIIITHRLSSVRKLDKIFVVGNGRIEEFGNHEELMELKEGVYWKMINSSQGHTIK